MYFKISLKEPFFKINIIIKGSAISTWVLVARASPKHKLDNSIFPRLNKIAANVKNVVGIMSSWEWMKVA